MRKIIFLIILRWLWVVLIIVAMDIVSKQWILNNMILHHTQKLIPFLNFFYTHNYGGIFGFLAHVGSWQRWLFVIITIIIIITLIVMIYINKEKILPNISCTFIIGGALGNLFDRLYRGFVIDFIDFYIGNWHFATFNVADCFICVGTMLGFLDCFMSSNNIKSSE